MGGGCSCSCKKVVPHVHVPSGSGARSPTAGSSEERAPAPAGSTRPAEASAAPAPTGSTRPAEASTAPSSAKAAAAAGSGENLHAAVQSSAVASPVAATQASRISAWVESAKARGAAIGDNAQPYAQLAKAAARSDALPTAADVAISNDVPRTFFASWPARGAQETDALARLLRALVLWDPEVAYCQGMNYVVFFALRTAALGCSDGDRAVGLDLRNAYATVSDEQETSAFSLVTCLMQHYGARALFLDRTPLLKLYSFCFARLMERRLPSVQRSLEGLDGVLGFKWFGTLFTTILPPQAVMRVWDVLFRDGLPALLCVALALCSLVAPALEDAVRQGEEAAEVMGQLQRQLPVDTTPLLPTDWASSAPDGEPEALAAIKADAAGERLVDATERYLCSADELDALLAAWRREHPSDAVDLGEAFSFRRHAH